MTTEKILTTCYSIAAQLDENNREIFTNAIEKNFNATIYNNGAGAILAELVKELKNDIACKTAKNNGNAELLKLIKSILKTAPEFKPSLKFPYIENGFQFACDGYRAIKLLTIIDGFGPFPEKLEKININQFFTAAEKNNKIKLSPPDAGTLKNLIIEQKANKSKIIQYDFGNGLPLVNAQYLLEFVKAFPDALYFADNNYPTTRAIFILHTKGSAILMPIYKKG